MTDHEEKVPVRPFQADGISELDNNLPSWWVGLFVFTIIFSGLYLVYIHMLGGPTIQNDYEQSLASVPSGGTSGGETGSGEAKDLPAMIGDGGAISAGKATYLANCGPCHGQNGEGLIGPNLTDKFWLHGGAPDKIYNSIFMGVVEKGMPAWGAVVGEKKSRELTAFVVSLKGSNPPNAKAAQGAEEN